MCNDLFSLHLSAVATQSSEARVHSSSLSPMWVPEQRHSHRIGGLEELLEVILPGYFETV